MCSPPELFPVTSPSRNSFRVYAVAVLLSGLWVSGCDDFLGNKGSSRSGLREVVGADGVPKISPDIAPVDALRPEKIGKLNRNVVPECSGLSASVRSPGVFWALSDSGDTARIVAIHADGSSVAYPEDAKSGGVIVSGAENVDWEAIAVDRNGRMIIGDIGNNLSARRDLCLYVVDTEPDPAAHYTRKARRVPFHYADQREFPEKAKNHDAEAMFCHRGSVYVFTKHWSDKESVLHRIDMTASTESRPTEVVARFDANGMVTDAAVSPDGRRLAVLTYTGIWIFNLPQDSVRHPLSGRALYRPLAFPLTSWQVEAVSFIDDETLLIGSEEGDLYKVRLTELFPER